MKFKDRQVLTPEEGRVPIKRRSARKVLLRVRSQVTLHRRRETVLILLNNQGAVWIGLQEEEENTKRTNCTESLGILSLLHLEVTTRKEKTLKLGYWECESISASTTTPPGWNPTFLSISCMDKLPFGGNSGQE